MVVMSPLLCPVAKVNGIKTQGFNRELSTAELSVADNLMRGVVDANDIVACYIKRSGEFWLRGSALMHKFTCRTEDGYLVTPH